jgi:hypothetical protein
MEIVFFVDLADKTGVSREFYTATTSRDDDTRKWATTGPATVRWEALQ